ncbi:FMN-linked oxidoreductase [Polychaeton citri CBS 116435]|uniref:FMN-linked oxidoreductase n=1 Tax=Polychaeton citri CBS 116435 TaxID=1314669 RepID=A0A9P4UIZ5_9PEZI|nr:FMN-linked oxidoreductase [Polychaeton citri CBS 116435]
MTEPSKRVPIPKNGVDYRGKIVLAPMVRSGECPSRLLALRYGADLVWGPETIDKALIGTTRQVNDVTKAVEFTRLSSNGVKSPDAHPNQRESIIYRLHPDREGRRLIYQIGTANPVTAVQAARLVAPDVAGIDVNAGCPKPFSTSGGMGAALLKTPDKLCAILEALVKEVGEPNEIGISVKIRILDTPDETGALVSRLVKTGITGLTVHCRTTPMRPRERAIRDQLRMVAEICHEAGVACLMNGDVTSRDEALKLMEEFGVDGAMIATAAETNPSVFRAESEGGVAPWREVVHDYVKASMEVENRFGNTKYLLGQMIPGKQSAYKAMMASKSYSQIAVAVGLQDDAAMMLMAEDTDRKLELGAFERPKMSKAERKAANKATAAAKADATTGATMDEPASAGRKRTADDAQLDVPADVRRETGPGTVPEHASTLVV